jgi:hypothetical protein
MWRNNPPGKTPERRVYRPEFFSWRVAGNTPGLNTNHPGKGLAGAVFFTGESTSASGHVM